LLLSQREGAVHGDRVMSLGYMVSHLWLPNPLPLPSKKPWLGHQPEERREETGCHRHCPGQVVITLCTHVASLAPPARRRCLVTFLVGQCHPPNLTTGRTARQPCAAGTKAYMDGVALWFIGASCTLAGRFGSPLGDSIGSAGGSAPSPGASSWSPQCSSRWVT
jgi:hypothetical protein